MQCGEMWNLGVMLYTFYQGEFPFMGNTDEEIIAAIISRPNNWSPNWREGICDILKDFILLCLEADPFKRSDKIQFINHAYILQNHTPQEIVMHNRILVQSYQRIYEIYAHECFVDSLLTYFTQKMLIRK